jgi:hypothetical protein
MGDWTALPGSKLKLLLFFPAVAHFLPRVGVTRTGHGSGSAVPGPGWNLATRGKPVPVARVPRVL